MKDNNYFGTWRITEMDTWNQDYADMKTGGFFDFQKDGYGEFQLGLVAGSIDYKIESFGGEERLEFSWDGEDENDMESLGRGWAKVNEGRLEGKFYFHLGDEFRFKAEKQTNG